MRAWILLISFLLAPALAHAEELERSGSAAPPGARAHVEPAPSDIDAFTPESTGVPSEAGVVERGAARFERSLEARVGEMMAQRVAAAGDRAMAVLERREAEGLRESLRAAARRAEPPRAAVLARAARRGTLEGELAIVRIGYSPAADRSH